MIILFLSVWLCAWIMGELFAIREVLGLDSYNGPQLFILIWLIGWSVGGFFVLKTLWWMIAGKEVVLIGQGALTIEKPVRFFINPKLMICVRPGTFVHRSRIIFIAPL